MFVVYLFLLCNINSIRLEIFLYFILWYTWLIVSTYAEWILNQPNDGFKVYIATKMFVYISKLLLSLSKSLLKKDSQS